MTNKHAWWAWAVKNSVCISCWTGLAIIFNHWWIALFALLFMSTLETKANSNPYHFICDCCGRYSPEGNSRDEAEQRRIESGWIRRKIDDKWEDVCPECQKNLLRKDREREHERYNTSHR